MTSLDAGMSWSSSSPAPRIKKNAAADPPPATTSRVASTTTSQRRARPVRDAGGWPSDQAPHDDPGGGIRPSPALGRTTSVGGGGIDIDPPWSLPGDPGLLGSMTGLLGPSVEPLGSAPLRFPRQRRHRPV